MGGLGSGLKWLWRRMGKWCEPYIVLYLLAMLLHMPVLTQYVYSRISEQHNFTYSYQTQSKCHELSANDSNNEVLELIQRDAARFQIGFSMCNFIPSVFACLFLGSWSDRVGRKPIIALSVLGGALETSVILATIYFKLPIWVILLAGIANGIGGFYTGLMIGSITFITDITPKEGKAVRLAVLEGFVFIGSMFSSFSSGVVLDDLGFANTYWCVWACMMGSLLYIIFVLRESVPAEVRKSRTESASGNCCWYPRKVFKTLMKPRSDKWKLKLALPGLSVNTLAQMGIAHVFLLFLLNRPLCFNAKEVGYFNGTRFVVVGVGAAVGLKILVRFISEYKAMLVGSLSQIAAMCMFGFSNEVWMIYLSVSLALFSGITSPIYRSIVSNCAAEDEQGAIFSLSTSLEMFATLMGNIMFNAIYSVSLKHLNFPGLVFVIDGGLTVIPFLLALVYGIKLKTSSNQYDILTVDADSIDPVSPMVRQPKDEDDADQSTDSNSSVNA